MPRTGPVAEAHRYATKAAAGKILCGKYIRLAAVRHLKDLEEAHKRGYYFSPAAAEHILKFFSFLRHSKGEWARQPFVLQPWQMFVLAVQYGWLRESDGLRRFDHGYTELPRKNGKSTKSAGKGNYHFVADNEPGAEVYAAATKKDQARIIWMEAKRQIIKSPPLARVVTIFRNSLSIDSDDRKFEPLGADSDTLDGLNTHAGLIDELHAHKNRGVYDIIDTSTSSRRQPMIDVITTAGSGHTSICWELHDHTIQVLEGKREDDAWFGFIASADPEGDWRDKKAWFEANPNLGISKKIDKMESACRRAIAMPGYENTFKRLDLGIWTNQVTRWIRMEDWSKCDGEVDRAALRSVPCWAGLDLSMNGDFTALSLVFPMGGRFKVIPFFWLPEDGLEERAIRDRAPYDQWVKEGLIHLCPGNVIDNDFVVAQIQELNKEFNIKTLTYDPWRALQVGIRLNADGMPVVPMRQGYASISGPSGEFEKAVISRRLDHGGNKVLWFMANNAVIKKDPAGNIKPDKASSTARIDGIVSTIMGIGAYNLNEPEPDFPYNEHGIYFG